MTHCLLRVESPSYLCLKAATDERFAQITGCPLQLAVHQSVGIQLRIGRSLSVEHFVEEDPQRPNIDFVGEDGRVHEGLGRQVAVSAHSLRSKQHFGMF